MRVTCPFSSDVDWKIDNSGKFPVVVLISIVEYDSLQLRPDLYAIF